MLRLLARNDGKIIVVARSKASAERQSNLAKSLSDGRGRLLRLLARNDGRKMSRNDGKIVVVARSEASAERRDNLIQLFYHINPNSWNFVFQLNQFSFALNQLLFVFLLKLHFLDQ